MTLLLATGFDVMRGAVGYLFREYPGSVTDSGFIGPGDVTGRHTSWPSLRNGGWCGTKAYKLDTVDKHATIIMQWAMKLSNAGSGPEQFSIYLDGWSDDKAVNAYARHLTLAWDARGAGSGGIDGNGRWRLWRGLSSSGTELANADLPEGIIRGNWYDWVFKATVADSGSWLLQVDGGSGYQTVMSGSGDTRNGGYDSLVAGICANFNSSYTGNYVGDDLIIMNGAGSDFNDILGARQVMEVYPTSDQAAVWTGSDGNSVNNYALVDESLGNELLFTDYVEGRANGDEDLYVCSDLPVALTAQDSIDAVVTYVHAQRVDSGARHLQISTGTASGTLHSPDRLPPISTNFEPLTWRCLLDTNATKPGGGAWTEAAVNDLRIGQKVTA